VRENTIRRLKAAGKPILNAWLSSASPYGAEVVAHLDFDAVTVDCQHGMIGFESAVAMLQAISTSRAIPLVRPSRNDAAEIMRFLDAGAYGVICPMISTGQEAAELVAACRYPPHGTRSFGPARGLTYGGTDYPSHANTEILILAMIETATGIDNLDAILATTGLDGIYVGPNDLALALGCAPAAESADRRVVEAVERIRAATVERGKIAGIFCSDGAAAARRLAEGFDLVTPGNDMALMRKIMSAEIAAARPGLT
jgi:4-hydroxy-2-oxoheptanedioate aldolase